MFRFKVEGLSNIPKKTNFIVVANHTSFLDSVAVGAAIPKKIYWLASRYLYRIPWLKVFLRLTRTFPIGGSSEAAVSLLAEGKNVGLFPEGRCSHKGTLGEFRRGAALLSFKTGRPVVPCAIVGAYQALPRTAKFPKLVPIKVKIGKPVYLLREFEEVIDDIDLQEGISEIRDTIRRLLYEE